MKVVVFASGNGTNAENIFKLAKSTADLEVVGLICDKENAGVLERAKNYSIPAFVLPFNKDFASFKEAKKDQEGRLQKTLAELDFDWICLAGYMRVFSPEFVASFYREEHKRTNIINIHPSLLPSFKGKDAYADAFTYGVTVSGATPHFVSAELDSGPILCQQSFPRLQADSLEEFRARGMEVEYKLYEETLLKLLTHDPELAEGQRVITWKKKCE